MGHHPRPREYSFVAGADAFIQRLPTGRYRVSVRRPGLGRVFLNGMEVKTAKIWRNISGIEDFAVEVDDLPVEVTGGRLVVDTRGGSFSCLNIVPERNP